MRRRTPIVQLLVFLGVSAVISTYLAFVLGDVSTSSTNSYSAVFTDVSNLSSNSPVRVAGVDVGSVDSVSIYHGDEVKVDFEVDNSIQLTTKTAATVRYKNLIGDRYLELAGLGAGDPLKAGAQIPPTRTSPALDLDTLLNGFKPLFSGLDPKQINALSMELIQVFQGESGTVDTLLSNVASVTGTLADRDQLIGNVIDNLDTTLRTVDAHSTDLAGLITQTQQLISGLNTQRNPIADALDHIDRLTTSADDLLTVVRPDLKVDVGQLGQLANTLMNNEDTLTYVLHKLPHAYQVLARLGSYGNFFNFYLCQTSEQITIGSKVYVTPPNNTKAARCQS